MIDLHMHTIYSDGTDSVKEILKKCQKAGLEVISITDHNSCKAYYELEKMDIEKYYKRKIIVGCEFTTSYKGRLIEVLGYGFDYKQVFSFLNKYYSKEKITKSVDILYKRLLDKIKAYDLIFNEDNSVFTNSEFFEHNIYSELIKYEENKERIGEDILSSFSDFFRKGLTNPTSKLFINHMEFKPDLKEVIDVIHNSGGKVFLAHAYQYKFDDTEDFIDDMYCNNPFDGIECYYTIFSNRQTNYLLGFAEKGNLLISGGSDYHGTNKKLHDLGIGNGNLKIEKSILNNWNIEYFK